MVAQCENVSSGICGQRRPSSACASAQSNRALCCPLTESMDTIEYIRGERMSSECDFAHAWDESESAFCACSRTPFCLGVVHIMFQGWVLVQWIFTCRTAGVSFVVLIFIPPRPSPRAYTACPHPYSFPSKSFFFFFSVDNILKQFSYFFSENMI